MHRLGSRFAVLSSTAAAVVLAAAGPSYAGGLQQCLDQAANHDGEPPTCTKVNGGWVASWPDDSATAGLPSGFIALVVFAVVVGIAITVWKVSTAQSMARRSGMDPGLATQMTLLTDDGLEATYLAANLRPQAGSTADPTPMAGSTSEARLTELQGLLDKGLVTQAEYDERRKAIIDAV
jgi:hypothetical protein